MAQCKLCKRKRLLGNFPRRLDIPELRSMVSHWPWHRVQVCPQCLPQFDQQFAERVQHLAPQVVAEGGDVSEPVCLMCGTQDPDLAYIHSGRWVDPSGEPMAGRFSVCQKCRGTVIRGPVISSTEIHASPEFEKILQAMPQVQPSLVSNVDGWDIVEGQPQGAAEVLRNLPMEAAVSIAEAWWSVAPRCIADSPGITARAAMIHPEGQGKIGTHLVLAWRNFEAPETTEMDMWLYRLPQGYTIVRFDPRPA